MGLSTVLLVMGLVNMDGGKDFRPNNSNVLSAPGGRYVFGQVSDNRSDQYLLDTETGKMWHMKIDRETQKPVLIDIPTAK